MGSDPQSYLQWQHDQETKPARDLAKLVIEVLDAQKQYFKTRDRQDLIASTLLEAELRKMAEGILEEPI